MTPEFSPAMLRLFLHGRCRLAHALGSDVRAGTYGAAARRERDRLRRLAGITATEMDFAWAGRLLDPGKRVRLWAVLGHFPGDHGILLTHGGQMDGQMGGQTMAESGHG